MAAVTHLPHVLANVLVAQAAGALGGERLPATGPSFRDATRVAGANPGIWADIYRSNREALLDEVDGAIAHLQRGARACSRADDATALDAWQATAAEQRRTLLEARRSPAGRCASCASRSPTAPASSPRSRSALGRAGHQHHGHVADAVARRHAAAASRSGSPRTHAGARAEVLAELGVDARMSTRALRPERAADGHARRRRRTSRSPTGGAARRDGRRRRSAITNYLEADDTRSTLRAVAGARRARRAAPGRGRRSAAPGCGGARAGRPDRRRQRRHAACGCCRAGSPAQDGRAFTLDGDASIRRRPVDRIAEPLRADGRRDRGHRRPLPAVHGHRPAPARRSATSCRSPARRSSRACCSPGCSPRARRPSSSRAQPRPHRAAARRRRRAARAARATRSPSSSARRADAPGGAAPCPATRRRPRSRSPRRPRARLAPRSIQGCGVNPTRTGFITIVQRMGAIVLGDLEEPPADDVDPDRRADRATSTSRRARCVGTVVEPHEVPLAIDELPLVALLGCFAEGETVVTGAQELRVKESDRIAGVVEALNALGGDVEATDGRLRRPRDRRAARRHGATRTATTAWRCSAPSPASPRRDGVDRRRHGGRGGLLSSASSTISQRSGRRP